MATTATTATAGLGLLFLLVLIAHSVTGDSVSPTLISTISLLQNNATTAHNTTTNATTTSKPPTTQQSHTTTQSSTTARTTALPEPGVGSYNVSQQSLVCLRADLALRLYVNYQDNAGNIKVGQFNVDPKDTVASGKCGDTEALLNLTFSHGFVLAMFTKDKNEVSVTEVNATLKYQFPDAKVAGE
ncbi:lysosome-associated membrane glycoprotein 3-like [Lampetra planeri]